MLFHERRAIWYVYVCVCVRISVCGGGGHQWNLFSKIDGSLQTYLCTFSFFVLLKYYFYRLQIYLKLSYSDLYNTLSISSTNSFFHFPLVFRFSLLYPCLFHRQIHNREMTFHLIHPLTGTSSTFHGLSKALFGVCGYRFVMSETLVLVLHTSFLRKRIVLTSDSIGSYRNTCPTAPVHISNVDNL